MNNVECESCVKRKTMYCPNSFKCYATKDKPYWQNRIMLLEENNQLKEQRQELRSWLEEEIKEEYRLYKEFLRIGVIKGETKLTSQFKRVLSKLNELEGKNE